jgi:hypothetical protein
MARWLAIALSFFAAAFSAWEVLTPRLAVRFETPAATMWPARLAMAACAAGGIAAVFALLARLADRRAAAYAAAILATTPAWFLHGRTSTGAIVPLAASAVLLAAIGIATLDDRASPRVRLASASVALATLAAVACAPCLAHAGGTVELAAHAVASAGGLAAIAAPALLAAAAGLAGAAFRGGSVLWLSTEVSQGRRRTASRDGSVLWLSTEVSRNAEPAGGASRLRSGTKFGPEPISRARPATVAALAVATALVAAAAAIVAGGADGALASAIAGAHVAGARATFESPVAPIAYALVPWTPLVPLAFVRRRTTPFERAILVAAATAVAMHALLAPRTGSTLVVGAAPIACAVALALRSFEEIERPSVLIVAVVVVIGLLVARDVDLDAVRVTTAAATPDLGLAASELAPIAKTARGATMLTAGLGALALVLPRAWMPTGRGLAVLFAGAIAGLGLRTYAYPLLLTRLSPGEAFAAYVARHAPEEPIATLGVDPRALPASVRHARSEAAAAWLLAGERPDHGRRFLALAAAELPRVNAAYRAARGENVPILAGGSGSVLLAASALAPGETSENALDRLVLHEAPRNLHPLGATLGDRLEAVGWDLVDDRGRPLDVLHTGSRAHLRVAVRVLPGAATLGGYCTFIHVEHQPTRFSAEHLDHAYPMPLWREGDVVLDDFEVTLPPAFGGGSHPLYWGVGVLPCHDDRRLPITSGPDDGRARVPGGLLEVR